MIDLIAFDKTTVSTKRDSLSGRGLTTDVSSVDPVVKYLNT
jgi:hypothetical protein